MARATYIRKKVGASLERLAAELRRRVLIESTGSSLRLSGSKVNDAQVTKIMKLGKFSERKQKYQTK